MSSFKKNLHLMTFDDALGPSQFLTHLVVGVKHCKLRERPLHQSLLLVCNKGMRNAAHSFSFLCEDEKKGIS